MIKQQQPFLSSVVQMVLLPCSLLVNLDRSGLMGPIAVAAYSYMALVPIIQPPIMKLIYNEKRTCDQDAELTSGIQT